jgi:hypothetical protein
MIVTSCYRESSKTNGTVNGEVHNHIDSQLDYLNSGKFISHDIHLTLAWANLSHLNSGKFTHDVQHSLIRVHLQLTFTWAD